MTKTLSANTRNSDRKFHRKSPIVSPSVIILSLSISTAAISLLLLIGDSLENDGIRGSFSKVSFIRLNFAIFIPAYIAFGGLKTQSLNASGALLGTIVAFVLTITRWCFFWALMAFFVSSTKATKYKQEMKKKIEGDKFKLCGQTDWIRVICNGGVATLMAILYLHSEGLEQV